MNIVTLDKILSQLKIPKDIEQKPKTFLEIIKISHRETIIANILAYYFNPNNTHDLNDLFIKSLFKIPHYQLNTKIEKNKIPSYKIVAPSLIKVKTEVSTQKNNRIDILIKPKTNEAYTIAIEFKINHKLDNPLDDYIDFVENDLKKENALFFVLTPFWKQPQKEHSARVNAKFSQIILSHLIKEVRKDELSQNLENGNTKEAHFYQDFLQTIENRSFYNKMIKKYIKFSEVEGNFEKLNTLYYELLQVKSRIDSKAEKLKKELKNFKVLENSKKELNTVLVKDIVRNKNKVGQIKIRFKLSETFLELWRVNPDFKKISSKEISENFTIEQIEKEIELLEAEYLKK